MWGGVKHRAHHGDLFRTWSASQNLETLRRKLYREPRPWYLAWKLHEHRHLLSDYHCARLLSWCVAVVQLERRSVAKRNAYAYAQQVFQFMVHSHKVGHEGYQEFFRLCAAGRDLTTAFRWQQYLVETGSSFPLSHYTWLLCVAATSPSDESVEDMAEAVWETYLSRYCAMVRNEQTGVIDTAHFQPSNEEEHRQLVGLFAAFKVLKPRIEHTAKAELLQFIDSLPTAAPEVASAWPTSSRHCTFPHLEGGVPYEAPTLLRPCLRDSLLHQEFVAELEKAGFSHDVKSVVALINEYKERVTAEKNHTSAEKHRAGERDIWRQYADPTAAAFRKLVVEEGGVTAELYHYLIVALSTAHPSLALRTLQRMRDAKLRVLDLTRAVVIVRSEGSPQLQLELLKEGLMEIEDRKRIDEDYDVTREVELYWKFNYVEFFHYRNALNKENFYRILMEGLGPVRVQELLVEAKASGDCSPVDIVVLDGAFRTAAAKYYRGFTGKRDVEKALDDITGNMPKLDISLVGSCEHFGDYALPSDDLIATDAAALAAMLVGYRAIYLLDSSFVESSEAFLTLGQSKVTEGDGPSLVLVPQTCLQQLSAAFDTADGEVVTYDGALQKDSKAEQFLATQRLRGLFALVFEKNDNIKRRVLHFTECLISHTMESSLDPGASDNDHLLLVLAMLRAIAPRDAAVVLCTDDPQLVRRMHEKDVHALFAGAIGVISSEPPSDIDTGPDGLIDDNPDIAMALDFEPKLNFNTSHGGSNATGGVTDISGKKCAAEIRVREDSNDDDVSWLDMLGDDRETKEAVENSLMATTGGSPEETKEDAAQKYTKLMDTYESEHSVVPVGVLMAQASSLGSVFEQFDVLSPDAALEKEMADASSAAASARDPKEAKAKFRRRSPLQLEQLRNRGASNKQRYRLARHLSNFSGGRVPFNFRYKVVEVDVTDARNKAYKDAYTAAVTRKREAFKRNIQG
uniref:Uncharacterized protein n=1 Tax=Trypanosoma congolense (strain IL3000) TaxID=1068625 RepID=G0UKW6_TRYCI|nr:conserved hypothetical protein [Trypanosoma congolense IL3000]